jgi:hypothetical protein
MGNFWTGLTRLTGFGKTEVGHEEGGGFLIGSI